jgi:3',5'-cyclic AMP phosphodiesterase CpdA
VTEQQQEHGKQQEHGMTRRQLLRHTAWFGSAVVLTIAGGEVISQLGGGDPPSAAADDANALRFVQISDSHIGFTGPANTMVEQSFSEAIGQINALPYRPSFVMHTGDLTHLSTPDQFDQVRQMLGTIRTDQTYTVPGEHDGVDDHGAKYRQFFGKGTKGDGWYSFDLGGAHFISLVNTLGLETMGHLGADQLEFVRKDVAHLSSDTPIVVFSHIPLFAMYPKWGWSTDDSVQALSYLKRFASVTCLNGHVHQLFTKTEGNVTFFSATTTAYPLPKPGEGPAPTPVTLPAGQLHAALGIREVSYVRGGQQGLAIKDRRLV